MADIDFFSQDIPFKVPRPAKTRRWIREVISLERKALVHLNYIFCSDDHLLQMNQQYLQHDTFTDILTFDNSEQPGHIEGDVFVSIDRVSANAETLGVSFDEELHRVIIHGVLHLIGYGDKTSAEKALMRKKEDAYLSLRKRL